MVGHIYPSTSESQLAEIVLRGATAREASMSFLSNPDIHAHNTFEQRDVVVPETKALSMKDGILVIEFPPASAVALSIHLN
ncbi:MAG: alpha-L-arabinofuranosidase C-terminal domain-containing protein [Candidatus Acidiferrum sp.]